MAKLSHPHRPVRACGRLRPPSRSPARYHRARNRGSPCRRKASPSALFRALELRSWVSPSAAPFCASLLREKSREGLGLRFPGGLYDKVAALSPFWRAFPSPYPPSHVGEGREGVGLVNGPKIRPPLSGQALGLSAAPGIDLAVVTGGQHLRDSDALPYLRPGELRVFDQAQGKALICR